MTWLLVLGAAVVVLLNMIVIVEPHQQAVKLSRGRIVGEPVSSGVLWKLPWPFQTAEIHDVTTIRSLHLGSRQVVEPEVQLWTDDLGKKFDREIDPFLVGRSERQPPELGAAGSRAGSHRGLHWQAALSQHGG